ncbi:MAG: exodeoxyribonuclease VII small subunit [Candidatus Competibacteraceae bacterium]
MNNSDLNPDSFDQAYAVLKRNAAFLSSQQEPGIDRLLPLVEESMQAYTICKARLKAIQQALAQHLEPENGNLPVTTPVGAELSSLEGVEPRQNRRNRQADEDEIPF